jgi:hypothetical protein
MIGRVVLALLVACAACNVRQDLGTAASRQAAPVADAEAPPPEPAFATVTTRAGWRWVQPFPTGDDLRGIVTTPAGESWLLGAHGSVFRRDVGGHVLEMLEPDGETRYYAGWASSAKDVWIVGERRGGTVVQHWDGQVWTDTYSLRDFRVHAMTGTTYGYVWAASDGAVHAWTGNSWEVSPAPVQTPLRALWGDNDEPWVVGDGGVILEFHQGKMLDARVPASSPVFAPERNYVAVWGTAYDDVWAAYEAKARGAVGFVHYDGEHWADGPRFEQAAPGCFTEPASLAPWARGVRMSGTSASRIVALFGQGCSFVHDGTRWSSKGVGPGIVSVGAAGKEVLAVGDSGTFVRGSEADGSWSPIYPAWRDDISAAAPVQGVPWALSGRRIVRLAAGEWLPVPDTEGATAFSAANGDEFWFSRAGGPPGETDIIHRIAGQNRVEGHIAGDVRVMGWRSGSLWVAGAGGLLMRGDGRNFERLQVSAPESFTAMAFLADGSALVAGTAPGEGVYCMRRVIRAQGADIDVLVTDDSTTAQVPLWVGDDKNVWVGGLPPLHYDGTTFDNVSTGDDAPVEAITARAPSGVWLAGGGFIRALDGASNRQIFTAGRVLSSMISIEGNAWAVGERGATLTFLPNGTPLR